MMREDFEPMYNQLRVMGYGFAFVLALLILLILSGCGEKETDITIETDDVCNNRWQCGWKYQQFIDTYGQPDTVRTDTIHLGGQLHRLRTIAYWPCYRPGQGDEPPKVKYIWLYAEFTDWTLVSWVFLDHIPKKKSHTLYYPKSSHQKKR